MAQLPSLLGLNREQLAAALAELGEQKSFRTSQLQEWIWKKRVTDFEQMTNLPPDLRRQLASRYSIMPLQVVEQHRSQSGSATCKFLSRLLRDDELIESVLIPAAVGKDGDRSNRVTLCVSSQVGCAFGCRFCASGLLGLKRSLTTAELIGQIFAAESLACHRVDNLVFMGMGEPLANIDNLLPALHLITDPSFLAIGARHITISTSGHVQGLARLETCGIPVRLAVSMHGATDDVRSQIMPVNRRWPLSELLPALENWRRHSKHIITLEYILISGVNDDPQQSEHLVNIARRLHAKVNLIPYNKVERLPWERPEEDVCRRFCHELINHGIPCTFRYEKGHDIDAACGQLRRRRISSPAKSDKISE